MRAPVSCALGLQRKPERRTATAAALGLQRILTVGLRRQRERAIHVENHASQRASLHRLSRGVRRLGPRDHVTRDTDRRGCDSSGGVPDVPGGEVTGEALQHAQRHCTVDHVAKAVPPLTSTLKCSRPIKGRDGFKLPPNHLLIFFRAWLAACLGAASYRTHGTAIIRSHPPHSQRSSAPSCKRLLLVFK